MICNCASSKLFAVPTTRMKVTEMPRQPLPNMPRLPASSARIRSRASEKARKLVGYARPGWAASPARMQ